MSGRSSACASGPTNGWRLLGVDPGLVRTGYAVVGEHPTREADLLEAGVVRLNPKAALEVRLAELELSLEELIETHRPGALVCEQLYAHGRHPRTAILMGHARGAVLALAGRRGLTVISVSATRVKKLLTGNGHAAKDQVRRAVTRALALRDIRGPSDVTDAVAIALCGLYLRRAGAGLMRPRGLRERGG